MSTPNNLNVPAENVPYFTPAQDPAPGTAFAQADGTALPKIFQPLKIRGVVFQNRIWVSPLCQYSAKDGKFTDWHLAHLGGIIARGPGFTMIEATAVLPEGRITPEDTGIWSDEHIEPLARIVAFAHSQSQKIGIQIAHAGRKASTIAPWIRGDAIASKEVGGWPDNVWGPSAAAYSDIYPQPKALTKEGIQGVIQAFVDGAKRAVKAGVDVIEIHAAHGFLIGSFLSPASNKRTDNYGGSFENRTRLLLEIVDAVRSIIPDTMPLFVRISATDWLEHLLPTEPSWRSEDTARLAPILYDHGVDLLDISTGGTSPEQKIMAPLVLEIDLPTISTDGNSPQPKSITRIAYQARFSRDVMRAVGAKESYTGDSNTLASTERPLRLLVSAVGAIKTGLIAEKILEDGDADVIFAGRAFIKNPSAVWEWAEQLSEREGADSFDVKLGSQMGWPFEGRAKKT